MHLEIAVGLIRLGLDLLLTVLWLLRNARQKSLWTSFRIVRSNRSRTMRAAVSKTRKEIL